VVPRTPTPRDRFDDIPVERGARVGAHRAENPRLRAGVVLLWSIVAVVVLTAAGIFGTMIATGRITLFPSPESTASAAPEAPGVVDTTYTVLVLNATTQAGLAGAMRNELIAAGWPEASVDAGDASSAGFETTTVFYPYEADESAARGLADLIGGADVALNASYQPPDDPETETDESAAKQLVIVIGEDRTDAGAGTDDEETAAS
jgi:hypothetical protein